MRRQTNVHVNNTGDYYLFIHIQYPMTLETKLKFSKVQIKKMLQSDDEVGRIGEDVHLVMGLHILFVV